MTKRILLAGVLAGLAMYMWTFVAHMVLPMGTVGIREIPNESAVLNGINSSIGTTDGLYMFPGMGLGPNPSMKQMRDAMPAYEQKLKTMPSGIMIYHPPGRPSMTGGQLGTEFVNEMIEAMLAVFLLSLTRLGSYGKRVAFMAIIGLVASMPTNVSYWNWYGFPGNYTVSYMAIQIIGFAVAGLVGAAVLGRGSAKALAAAA
jgi:hypothetical protein